MTKDNNLLGKFELSGIPPGPRGSPQIEVSFDVDENGILNVSAVEKSTGKSEKITITNNKGRLSKEDIDRLVKEAEKFKDEDDKIKEQIEARNNLENLIYSIKHSLNEEQLKDKFSEEEKTKITAATDEAEKWQQANPNAEKQEYET